MVEIQSKEVIDKISDELKIQPSLKIPRTLQDKIQLSYNINPKHEFIVREAKNSVTTTLTLFVVPAAPKRFFLTRAFISYAKDASSDNVEVDLFVNPVNNASLDLLSLVSITLTAVTDHQEMTFDPPVELDPGTNVLIVGATTVGAIQKSGMIEGFLVDRL